MKSYSEFLVIFVFHCTQILFNLTVVTVNKKSSNFSGVNTSKFWSNLKFVTVNKESSNFSGVNTIVNF